LHCGSLFLGCERQNSGDHDKLNVIVFELAGGVIVAGLLVFEESSQRPPRRKIITTAANKILRIVFISLSFMVVEQ